MASPAALRAMTKAYKKVHMPVRTGNYGPPPTKPAPSFEPYVIPFEHTSKGLNRQETRSGRSFAGRYHGNIFAWRHTDWTQLPVEVRGQHKIDPYVLAVKKYNTNAANQQMSPPYLMIPVGPLYDRWWNNGTLRRDRLKRERKERAERAQASRKRMKNKINVYSCRL